MAKTFDEAWADLTEAGEALPADLSSDEAGETLDPFAVAAAEALEAEAAAGETVELPSRP